MASIRAVAIKKALAVERLNDLTKAIAEQRGIELPPFKATGKDPQLVQAQQLEWMADVLELIATAPTVEKRRTK